MELWSFGVAIWRLTQISLEIIMRLGTSQLRPSQPATNILITATDGLVVLSSRPSHGSGWFPSFIKFNSCLSHRPHIIHIWIHAPALFGCTSCNPIFSWTILQTFCDLLWPKDLTICFLRTGDYLVLMIHDIGNKFGPLSYCLWKRTCSNDMDDTSQFALAKVCFLGKCPITKYLELGNKYGWTTELFFLQVEPAKATFF